MITEILADKDLFLKTVEDKLGTAPLNFAAKQHLIRPSPASPASHQGAGVMLLLYHGSEGFSFRLSKRSQRIPQAGDLSCPGGMLQHRWDSIIMKLLDRGVIPVLRNRAGKLARQRDRETFQLITLFLANAMREAWEEIRLNPFTVYFLGPLPAYSLQLYQRIIFPLVGLVPEKSSFRPNDEVESLVTIPVGTFLQRENYAALVRNIDEKLGRKEQESEILPCLIYRDSTGVEHILWGATFYVIMNFLRIIFNFQLPEWKNGRSVKKTIDAHYLSGNVDNEV